MDILTDVCVDTVRLIPFLFITYLLLTYVEHHDATGFHRLIQRYTYFGPFLGALFGLLPQCGFSVMASCLYLDSSISIGTLAAVFLSTSDEAIPMLLAHPDQLTILSKLMIGKLIIAMIVGYALDWLTHTHFHSSSAVRLHDHAHEEGLWTETCRRTFSVVIYIFVFSLLLSSVLDVLHQQDLSGFMKDLGLFQPLLCCLIGFIPNCASSIFLCELYLFGLISSGALFAGLCSNAGLGFMILLRFRCWKSILLLFTVLLISSFGASFLF